MKKAYQIAATVIIAFAIIISTLSTTYSNPSGAPASVSGSPGDGNQTCAMSGCHSGNTVQVQAGMISSDIPAEGYIPGQNYTITVTINQAGISRWGFQVSPQDPSGSKIGSMTLTNTGQTRLISSGRYITHTTSGNSGSSGSKSWTFDWVAPVAGTGGFSFYASVMAANNDGGRSGDKVFSDELAVNESTSTSIKASQTQKDNLSVFPNPSTGDELRLVLSQPGGDFRSVQVYSLSGSLVLEFNEASVFQSGNELLIPVSKLESGSYFIVAEHSKGRFVKRFIRK
jgi:hypothetical protein